jgi:DNA-binding winged helix-turn-helix (wHTH) protein/tetratricopeptide (TPR) repeat protein
MTVFSPELSPLAEGVQYNFGPFSFRPDGSLFRRSAAVFLPPKETLVLRLFLDHAGEIIGFDRLRLCAWGGTHVSPDSLPRLISSLRAHLGLEDCIQAIYKRGYRFCFPVERVQIDAPIAPVPEQQRNGIRRLLRLAILPLATSTGVPEYLGPGVAEETMLRLSRSRQPVAEVMARNSVFTLVAQGRSGQDVAKALGADLVLMGNIVPLSQHFRIRVEMVRVNDNVQIWVEDFLISRSLLAQADARIAKRVSARIRESFASSIAEVPHVRELSIESDRSEAYTRYLQAQSQWNTFERHLMQDSIRGLHQALDLDAGLISARVHLVHSYLAMGSFGYMRPDLTADIAMKLADQVLSTPSCAQLVLPAVGWIHFFRDRDPQAASAVFARVQMTAHNQWAAVYAARFALGQGRTEDGVQLICAALEIDPYAPALHWRLIWALHLAGSSDAAVEQAKRTIALFPNDPGALFFSVIAFAAANDAAGSPDSALGAEAVALGTRLTQLAPLLDGAFSTLAYAHARQGNHAEARAILDRQRWLGSERFVLRSFQAPALVELGDFDAALDALQDADEQRCSWLFELLGDPRLQPLHPTPEFRRLSQISGHTLDDDVSVA